MINCLSATAAISDLRPILDARSITFAPVNQVINNFPRREIDKTRATTTAQTNQTCFTAHRPLVQPAWQRNCPFAMPDDAHVALGPALTGRAWDLPTRHPLEAIDRPRRCPAWLLQACPARKALRATSSGRKAIFASVCTSSGCTALVTLHSRKHGNDGRKARPQPLYCYILLPLVQSFSSQREEMGVGVPHPKEFPAALQMRLFPSRRRAVLPAGLLQLHSSALAKLIKIQSLQVDSIPPGNAR